MNELMRDPKQWDGDCLLAFHFDEHNTIFDDILILTVDAYCDSDDAYLVFEGRNYNWEIDLHTVRRVLDFHANNGDGFSIDELIQALKYYIEFDACYDGRHRVGGKYGWGGGRLSHKRDPKEFRFLRSGVKET